MSERKCKCGHTVGQHSYDHGDGPLKPDCNECVCKAFDEDESHPPAESQQTQCPTCGTKLTKYREHLANYCSDLWHDSSPKQPASARELEHCTCDFDKVSGDLYEPCDYCRKCYDLRTILKAYGEHVTASLRADNETLKAQAREYNRFTNNAQMRAEAAERERDKETERANYNAEAAGANLLALKSAEAKLAKLWKALQIHGKHFQSCAKYKDRVYGETAYPSPDIECNCGLGAALQPQVELPEKGEKNG